MSETIVFVGDSITDCDRRTDPIGLGGGYVDAVADALRERGDESSLVNAGVSGDRLRDVQARLQVDALDHRPTVLSFYIGVNDTLLTFFEGRPTPPDLFEDRFADLLERSTAAGIGKLIVVDPFFVGHDGITEHWVHGRPFIREDLDTKRPIVRKLAEHYGAEFVPLQDEVDAVVARRGPAAVAPDGIHPSALGHRLIARLWLNAYDAVRRTG
jgi:acyl-CoA thioesterase-1